jgi:ABC-2 type transport system permease protein
MSPPRTPFFQRPMLMGEPPGSAQAGRVAGKAGNAQQGTFGPPPQRSRSDRSVTAFGRIFFIGGVIAYRALFNWVRPSLYIPTMLIGPIFQILFFAYLGRYSGLEDDAFFVVGNAVQASAMSAVFAGTMTIANERSFQTLSALLATPANRFAVFMGRSLPVLVNGLVVSSWGFLMGRLLLRFDPPAASIPALGLVLVVSVASCTAFGLTLGSVGMRARDVFMSANIAYYVMWLLCGVNIPLDALPGWLAQIGRLLPLTHGIAAAREIAAGASLSSVGGLVWTELGIGAAWAVLAFTLVRWFEFEGRRRASLETY